MSSELRKLERKTFKHSKSSNNLSQSQNTGFMKFKKFNEEDQSSKNAQNLSHL